METQNAKQLKIVASGKPKKKLGRHTAAMVKSLQGRDDIDGVKREMLLGLARAWDRIEESGKGGHTIPSLRAPCSVAIPLQKLLRPMNPATKADAGCS